MATIPPAPRKAGFTFGNVSSTIGLISSIVGLVQFVQQSGKGLVAAASVGLYYIGFVAVFGFLVIGLILAVCAFFFSEMLSNESQEKTAAWIRKPVITRSLLILAGIVGVIVGVSQANYNTGLLRMPAAQRRAKGSAPPLEPLSMQIAGGVVILLTISGIVLERLGKPKELPAA